MADRYWVGGTANWDATAGTKWAATSGGVGGETVPTANDDVYIDANSGAVTVTATVSNTPCRSLSFTSPAGDFTGTWAGIRVIYVYGNLTLSSAMTSTWTGRFEMRGTGSFVIRTNGKVLSNDMYLVTGGSTWQLYDDFTIGSANLLHHQGGTLDMNGKTVSCGRFQSNSTTLSRTVNNAGATFNLTGNNVQVLDLGGSTSIPATFSTRPTFNCTYSGSTGTRTINSGPVSTWSEATAVNVNVTAGTDIVAILGTHTVNSLNFTGFAGSITPAGLTIYGDLTIASGMTLNASTSVWTFAATSGTKTITTAGKTIDNPLTFNGVGGTFQLQDNLTVGSTRTVTLTNGTLDLNNQTLSCGLFSSQNTNTRAVAFGTGNITLTGNAATVLLWGNSNLTATGSKNIYATYSGATGTRTFSTNSTGAVETNVPNIFITSGTDTIASISRVRTLDFTGFKGTYTSGTTKTIYGSLIFDSGMTITSSGNTHTFATTSGNFIIDPAGLDLTFPINFNGIGGTWAFASAVTIPATVTVTNGTVQLKSGATSTVSAFATSGSNQKYLQSTTAGSQATLSQASGTVNASYLTVKDINATGGATWNAYRSLNNIDAGNNTGWDFLSTPVTTTTLAMRLGFGL